MGLDMYLKGDKFTPTDDVKHVRQKVDGYDVESLSLDLGYWRKHWALHNYIADRHNPNDDYKVELESASLRDIADAVEQGRLPAVEHANEIDAYYREPDQVANTAKVLRDAADWNDRDDGFWRTVEYYGSW